MTTSAPRYWLAAIILAAGLVGSAVVVGNGLRHLRTADRYVTVKGIAEREVESDVALWPIRHTAADNKLSVAQQRIDDHQAAILRFLQRHGIDSSWVDVQGIEVTDVHANPWRSGPVESRYIIQQSLMVRSTDVARVRAASQKVGELVAQGVVLGAQNGPVSGPTYLFNELPELKPAMLAEATANARRVAEQFAADSGSRVGGIRHANQGVFQIMARDRVPGVMEEQQPHKTVRVVTTIQYFLQQ